MGCSDPIGEANSQGFGKLNEGDDTTAVSSAPDLAPLASILINNFNYGRFLHQAIDSALRQTYEPLEVIVVDDGSTDDSARIIRSYGHLVVPIFQTNAGQASAFNSGFLASRGETIFLLDADDVFFPHKVREVMALLQRHPQVEWCFHGLLLTDNPAVAVPEPVVPRIVQKCDFRRSMTSRGRVDFCAPATSGLCFRRSLLGRILPMPVSERIGLGDHYVKFLAMAYGPGLYADHNLAVQRLHDSNLMTGIKPEQGTNKSGTLMRTALWIRREHQSVAKFADNLMARGMALYWYAGKQEGSCEDLIRDYLALIPVPTRLRVLLRAHLHRLFATCRRKL